MNRVYRILTAVVPSPHNQWIRAHQMELEHVEGRWQRWRWALGLLPLTRSALASQLRKDPHTFLGGVLMKTIVAALSILNLAAGVGLGLLYVIETGPPLVVLALSAVLVIQGGFTLALILGAFHSPQDPPRQLQLVGSTLALVVGSVGFLASLLANISSVNNDPEYGPVAITALVAAHGLVSLLAFRRQRPVKAQAPTP